MKSFWNGADRDHLRERINSVSPTATAQWGRMNAAQMLSHLHASLKMATGEMPVKPRKLPIRFFPLKQLVLYLLPFPKGAPTAPELKMNMPCDLTVCRADLLRQLDTTFAARGKDWPAHPAFGELSDRAWGVLIYKHFDHHLRQFGA